MTDLSVHFSSASPTWDTPIDFFNKINNEFNFTLDPACMENSAKCTKYYTPETDGLSASWAGEIVWLNPPYGRVISDWIEKAYIEAQQPDTIVAMLLPARTDTKWFHEYCIQGEVRLIKGRLKFTNVDNETSTTAPFPSMLVVFGGKYWGRPMTTINNN